VKTTDTHPLWFLAGVFLTCMCLLMLQIIETRVLSVLASYTLALVAISVAMLGMTAGALLVGSHTDLRADAELRRLMNAHSPSVAAAVRSARRRRQSRIDAQLAEYKSGVRRRPVGGVVRLPCNAGAADRHRYV